MPPKSKSRQQELIQLAQWRSEKGELAESREAYESALKLSRKKKDLRSQMEALSGLLRLAGEALDTERLNSLEKELNRLIAKHPQRVPPIAWYCRGFAYSVRSEWRTAQRCFHRYLKLARETGEAEHVCRALAGLANLARERGYFSRSRRLAELALRESEDKGYRGLAGMLYLLMGNLDEKTKQSQSAMGWYQKAYGAYLAEHNWYGFLHVLFAFARLARAERNYAQAYWYLDVIDKAATTSDCGVLRRALVRARAQLEEDAVDLLIDSARGWIKLRERGQISLGKQYVLMNILEALSRAPQKGLSKAELIEAVWHERYRPEAHDNKLYYNINRLRKLIETDVRNPRVLMNWRQGYRLAPGLRVHLVGKREGETQNENK